MSEEWWDTDNFDIDSDSEHHDSNTKNKNKKKNVWTSDYDDNSDDPEIHDPLEDLSNEPEASNSNIENGMTATTQHWGNRRRRSSIHEKRYDDMAVIDWSHEFAKRRERKSELKQLPGLTGKLQWLYDASQVWIVILAIGLSSGFLAAIIDVVSQWLSGLRFGHCKGAIYLSKDFCCLGVDQGDECSQWSTWADSMGIHNNAGNYIMSWAICIVLAVGFASMASWLTLQKYGRYTRMSGMPELKTIMGGFVIKGFFGFKTLAVKAIGLCLVVGAGIWVGKEGPLVHLACCCANFAMKPFKALKNNEATKREVLCAAAAAGISVAFGAPIGGVLFALEQVAYYSNDRIMWHSFVCAMIAAVTLQTMNPFRTGQLVLFQVVLDRNWHRFEIFPFALIGIFGGLYGTVMIKLNTWFAQFRRRNKFTSEHPLLEVVLVALITTVVSFPDVYMRLQSQVLLSYLFQECSDSTVDNLCDVNHWFSTILLLLLASSVGLVLTAYSFGTNIPAGVLTPSMLVGAIGGRSVGVLMQSLHHKWPNMIMFSSCPPDGICITPGVYALVGAASALTGVTRLTVSSVVIMFELTGALTYVLPIMVGVIVSKWVGDSFGKMGIYESWIQLLQYPLLNKLDDGSIPDLSVEEVMTNYSDLSMVTGDMTVRQVLELMQDLPYHGYPVVKSSDDPVLIGYAIKREFYQATASGVPQDALIADNLYEGWIESSPITAKSVATLHHAALLFQSMGLRFLPITTQSGRLCGLLTRNDIWRLLGTAERRAELNDFGRERQLSDATIYSTDEALLTDAI